MNKTIWIGNCVATLICIGSSTLATAADHVLIMAASDYVNGGVRIQALPGVSIDITNAKKIAHKLGFSNDNITVLRDAELRKDNFMRNFQKFTNSVNNSDRVFVYYSGHGARVADGADKCIAGFLPSDSDGNLTKDSIIDNEMVSLALAKLKNRASEVTTLFDTCHAGGIASAGPRGVVTKGVMTSEWVSKGAENPEAVSNIACQTPTNYISRAVQIVKNEPGAAQAHQNFTYIAAAKSTESAIASSKGSLATNVILNCLDNGVTLTNSGKATVRDLINCAQNNVNQQMPKIKLSDKGWQGMTISAEGNTARPLWNVATKVEAQQSKTFSEAIAIMRNFEANADKRWGLQLRDIPTEVSIGTKFSLPYSAAQGGYFYILAASSDGGQFNLVYPPENQKRYRASTLGNVGGDPPHGTGLDASITITGPAADNHFLVIVSPFPKTFPKVFSTGEAKVAVAATPRGVEVSEVGSNAVANPLAGTYGAAYFVVTGR